MMDCTIESFPYDEFQKIRYLPRPVGGNHGKRFKKAYKDIVCAFDIETTSIREIKQGVMYIWQFQVGYNYTVFGRTWLEFRMFLLRLKESLKGMRLMIYVHNLSFEFQFLKGVLKFDSENVFSLDKRGVVKAIYDDDFEFRCSYILTNMSLALFTKTMDVEHKKLDGDLDYSIYRWWYTELTATELSYCRNDVQGLVEGIYRLLEMNNDSLYTIPLTSTGYVRRDVKHALGKMGKWGKIKTSRIIPSYHVFELLRKAFRGGNTHANRFFSDRLINEGNQGINSYDRKSSYPSELINAEFPMRPFIELVDKPDDRRIRELIKSHKPLLFTITFEKIKLRHHEWGCPYIPISKCENVSRETLTIDNGRVIRATKLTMTLTDIDFKIIDSEYTWSNSDISECWVSAYDKLPVPIREETLDYFHKKTELKGVEGEHDLYMKSKNKLNSIYGLMVENPCRETYLYDDQVIEKNEIASSEMSEVFEKANSKGYLSYAWGVWTTAHAREELEKGIRIAHQQATFLYTDTDSVKVLGELDLTEYNENMTAISESNGGVAYDIKGNKQCLGVFEQEDSMKQFVTMGAKKYGYLTEDDKIHITISGVNKTKGGKELSEHGGLDSFKSGFVFSEGGGLSIRYNDKIREKYHNKDGNIIEITDNAYLEPSTYTLGLSKEYANLLHNIKNGYYY